MELLGLSLAALVGLLLGVLGGGGSVLTVPIFVHVLGYAAKPAIAMSLPVVGVASLTGALSHWRAGNVDLRLAAGFGGIAMLGAFMGARLSVFLDGRVQLLMLGVLILGSAISMWRRSRASRGAVDEVRDRRPSIPLLGAIGLSVGVITGLVGIGGGFLFVPALVVLGGVPMKQAVGTSLLVIAMNATAGFLGYAGQVQVDWGFTALFTLVAVGGILAGIPLVRFVSTAALTRAFAIFLFLVGGLMLVRA